jgi:hypothetical protein
MVSKPGISTRYERAPRPYPGFVPGILICLALIQVLVTVSLQAQGFLHAEGKEILNGEGENVILRGIGTGNWMLQEGYMMETADIAPTQHEFREKLVNSIGEARADSFYTVWLNNHITRTDVDSLASWGFNSVRVAMHYKWFTLPIEDEPVLGEHTWLDRGFELIDSLLDWCEDKGIYLILDMHGAPGGQGKDAPISDYDPSKPSLWESSDNKDKLVALWAKFAGRYADEPWLGGYDLVNETNWDFPEGNNSQMRSLFKEITDSIRLVDTNHMIIIEGNSWANDFSRLTPPWDDNMVYSFHKYWSYNKANSLDWIINFRNTHKVPIWLGETGENSNTWYRDIIALGESNNIGWAMWPVKKVRINNPLRVEMNDDYRQLIDNWKGKGPFLSQDEAFQAVLAFADNHRIENCIYQRDVIDALFRQPHPYKNHKPGDTVFASNYDMGRNGYAYFDTEDADYHQDTKKYIEWNRGWSYRNDGVDMQLCEDTLLTNGYNVGWTDKGDWMVYTIRTDSMAAYNMEIRSASGAAGSQVCVEVNGVDATGPINLPASGGWQKWTTSLIHNLILPAGEVKLKIVFNRGGSNLNYFRLFNPQESASVPFRFVSAEATGLENQVTLSLNKPVSGSGTIPVSDFSLVQSGSAIAIDSIRVSKDDGRRLIVFSTENLFAGRSLLITYTGRGIMHQEQVLEVFVDNPVQNNLAVHHELPRRIQAESFYFNNGLELESCQDAGGGLNTGFANPGDYLDYVLYVPDSGTYMVDFRMATERPNATLSLQADFKGMGFETLQTIQFSGTGGWQNWSTQSTSIKLREGKYLFRLLVTGNEHNLNWIEFKVPVTSVKAEDQVSFSLYPNPASSKTTVQLNSSPPVKASIKIMDIMGRMVYQDLLGGNLKTIDTSMLREGIYVVILEKEKKKEVLRLIINRK